MATTRMTFDVLNLPVVRRMARALAVMAEALARIESPDTNGLQKRQIARRALKRARALANRKVA